MLLKKCFMTLKSLFSFILYIIAIKNTVGSKRLKKKNSINHHSSSVTAVSFFQTFPPSFLLKVAQQFPALEDHSIIKNICEMPLPSTHCSYFNQFTSCPFWIHYFCSSSITIPKPHSSDLRLNYSNLFLTLSSWDLFSLWLQVIFNLFF